MWFTVFVFSPNATPTKLLTEVNLLGKELQEKIFKK